MGAEIRVDGLIHKITWVNICLCVITMLQVKKLKFKYYKYSLPFLFSKAAVIYILLLSSYRYPAFFPIAHPYPSSTLLHSQSPSLSMPTSPLLLFLCLPLPHLSSVIPLPSGSFSDSCSILSCKLFSIEN